MRVATTVLTSALTSAVVSALVVAYLKYSFDRKLLRLAHKNQLELQETAQNLKIAYDALAEREKHRREALPRVAEQVYRVRNIAKEAHNAQERATRDIMTQLEGETAKLESLLYEQRLLLGMEGLFALVHTFKNEVKEFGSLALDLTVMQPEDRTSDVMTEFDSTYDEIDRQYVEIVDRITSKLDQ